MTPKEKAKHLIDSFSQVRNYTSYASPLCISAAKQCAQIAIDAIIYDVNRFADNNWRLERLSYLRDVKKEIEKV